MNQDNQSIEDKINDLEKRVEWFDSDDFSVDSAVEQYKAAKKLADDIEKDLENIKNEINIINKDT